MMGVPVLSIVVPVFNQAEKTIRCFASIRACTKTPYELIWVDNASSKPEFRRIHAQATRPRVSLNLIKQNDNTGFVRATNAGIRAAQGQYVVLLNNDTEVTSGWDTTLLQPLKDNPQVGAVGPITQSKIGWQEASNLNKRWPIKMPTFSGSVENYAALLDRRYRGQYKDIGSLPLAFFCVALRKTTFDTVGLLDEDFGVGLGDDDEFCVRLRLKGFRQFLSLGSFVYHHHRTTFKALNLPVDQIRRKNIATLKKKISEHQRAVSS